MTVTSAHVIEIVTYAAAMAVYVVEMTADAQEIAEDAAAIAVYIGEMTGYASEIMKFRIETTIALVGYGSKPTSEPCFVVYLGRNIQNLLAQA